MSRRNWSLFGLVGFLWGIPYLLIRVAIRDFDPAFIVFVRLVIGAAILIPIAARRKSLAPALRGFKYVLFYACLEMIVPWYLITTAETKISSGLTGLLVATTPIWSTVFTSLYGDKTVWHRKRLFGLVLGFIGVFTLVGIEALSGTSALWAIGYVLLSAVGYAYAVIMITRKLPGVSGIAINAVAMAISAVVYIPFAIAQRPRGAVSTNALLSLLGLGVLCTAAAFVVFFMVMRDIGPARASLVTYVNTAVAVLLGSLILSEPFTLGMAIGLPMVLVGSYFAGRKPSHL
ncbi:MAG: DMT family transporter [Candidatus Nanopelagicaceae bacterium]|jgi:drug/metabolite transporter (DMT)-like permease